MNKRKKVSFLYFLEESVKGLWRNGVMTFASVAVLMSCLVVLGSFVLLLYNVSYNIDNIGMLNYILVFVDTDRDSALETDMAVTDTVIEAQAADAADPSQTSAIVTEAPQQADSTSNAGIIVPRGLWDGMDEAELGKVAAEYMQTNPSELIGQVEASLTDLMNFTDLAKARVEVDGVRAKLAAVKTRQSELSGDDAGRYATAEDSLAAQYKRITALADIELEIKKLDNIEAVEFVSKAQALSEMNDMYSEYTDLFERLQADDNPLTDQFTITYKENEDVSTLKSNLENMTGFIYRVDCRVDIANSIENVRSGVVFVFIWFLVILLVVSMFVIINTIKLAVFSRRQEVAVMRYVGATNSFITMPFVFEGILIGAISSILAYIIQYYVYMYVHKVVMANFGFILIKEFSSVQGFVALGFIGIGVIAGIIGSVISLHKYLKA